MSLGNKLTWYLLFGVLGVMGLDGYLSIKRTHSNLLNDVRREVAAISRTLRVSLEKAGDDNLGLYFTKLAPEISGFDNVLGVAFYNREGKRVVESPSLQGRQLPDVDVAAVIATKTPVEAVFTGGAKQRYYRVEPVVNAQGEGLAAFLVMEDFPFFAQELRERMLQALLTTLLLLLVLSVIVSLVIHRSITMPLRAFAGRIEEIGEGQFDQRLQLVRRDEIGRLAQAFDHMCVRLEDAYRRLIEEGEEKLRLERALRHSQTLAALGQMASRLAHEIGTPLNVIQGRAEQLLLRDTFSEKERSFLTVIVAQIERISGFIRQLLTLARRSEPHLHSVNLEDIIHRVVDMLENHAHSDQVTLTLDLADPLPLIWGDSDQLQQVVLNLGVNALHAVGQAGCVTLRTRVLGASETYPEGAVELEVADTGPGIPPADRARVFEPFFTTKGREHGTGLGLTICREIVLNHRGEIRIDSDEGHGTKFTVSFPVARPSSEQNAQIVSQQKEKPYGNGIAYSAGAYPRT